MSEDEGTSRRLGRRQLFKYAGGAAALAAGAGAVARWRGPLLQPVTGEAAAAAPFPAPPPHDIFIGGTDGWISLPSTPAIPPFHPDTYAADKGVGLTTYIFGFRNITDSYAFNPQFAADQKNHAQAAAPMFWVDEYNPGQPKDFRVSITNLGLAQRPDLFDAHTLHWHGFRNVIPFFDGEPTGSVAVPAGSVFTYVYRPRDPGTYMYHCHVEDVEHVHMGMTGLVWVHPAQNGNTTLYPSGRYAYNDGDGSTGYDREYAMFLSEVWAEAHWADAHIQLPEWSDYHADFSLLNGRVYPDTIAPNAELDPVVLANKPNVPYLPVITDAGNLRETDGFEHLKYQPVSSLVTCMEGERVLLRFANLGFREATMTTSGLTMKVVGRDATPMVGRDDTDTSYLTNSLSMGAGESVDAIITAPPYTPSPLGYNRYFLYNRRYTQDTAQAGQPYGGQATEIHVYPRGPIGTPTLAPQTLPNQYVLPAPAQ